MKIIRIFLSLILIACMIFTFSFGKKDASDKIFNKKEEFKEVITVWHIDTFEGGKWSRREFLNYVAKKFEKKNVGVLIMVKSISRDGIVESINKGELPDIVSYGAGVDIVKLAEIKGDKTFNNGQVNKKQYALPWCKGGYVLFSKVDKQTDNKIEKLVVSQSEYSQPLLSFLSENILTEKIEVLPPLDAYVQFVTGKAEYFLGTQRDVERLQAKGYSYNAKPLEHFNDLYQYVSITEKGNSKNFTQKFIEYLLSEEIQKELTKISMFSQFYDISFENETLNKMSKIRQKDGLNLFLPSLTLKELQECSVKAVLGDDESLFKIKKLVVKS